MTTEKKDLTTRGKVVRVLVGQNGPYGIELDNSLTLRKSQFGTIVDLTGVKEGDSVEATYYESRDKAYAKAVMVVDAPSAQRDRAHDDLFVPEAETSAGTSADPEKAAGAPDASQPVPNGGQKKTWAEQQAEKDQYWTNKAGLDADRLLLDREKFEFEKGRADSIARQAAIKAATEIVLAIYKADSGPSTNPAEIIKKVYHTAYYLYRPLEVGFKQSLAELNRRSEQNGPAARQFENMHQAATGAGGPGM